MISFQDYIDGIDSSRTWYLALLTSFLAWSLSFVVDKSCEFIRLHGRRTDDGSGTFGTIRRGTQQGQLLPDSSCKAWGKYDGLELSSKMVTTRVAAAMSIVLGSFVLLWILLWPYYNSTNQSDKQQRRLVIISRVMGFLALACAAFQAVTHVMVKSDFCQESTLETTIVDDGNTVVIVWDECDRSTTAYNITYATMALFVVASVSLCWLSIRSNAEETSD